MALRKGKSSIFVVLRDETIKKLDDIAEAKLTSRSNIAGTIIEEHIDKYIGKDISDSLTDSKDKDKKPSPQPKHQAISYAKIMEDEQQHDTYDYLKSLSNEPKEQTEYDLLVEYLGRHAVNYTEKLEKIKNGELGIITFLKLYCDNGSYDEFEQFKESQV